MNPPSRSLAGRGVKVLFALTLAHLPAGYHALTYPCPPVGPVTFYGDLYSGR